MLCAVSLFISAFDVIDSSVNVKIKKYADNTKRHTELDTLEKAKQIQQLLLST